MENNALNYVFYEILEHVLNLSEKPSEFGQFLTQKIRELLGVKTVLITTSDPSGEVKILSIFPERRLEWAKNEIVLEFLSVVNKKNEPEYIVTSQQDKTTAHYLEELDIESYILIPLVAGEKKEGTLLLLNILDDNNIKSVIDLLEKQSGVFALIMRNTAMYLNLERDILKRTSELQAQNEEFMVLNEELKNTNQQLEIAKEKAEESDRLKTAFLANMSHEIRTPMNGILGFTEILTTRDTSEKDRERFLQIIKKSGERMLNTINSIIEISKIETGQVKPDITEVDINEQLGYFFEFFKPETKRKGLELTVRKLLDVSPWVYSDKNMLNSILTNLIKNAIKYSDTGKIDFGVDHIQENKNSFLLFFVKDNGIGISKDKHNTIFERFMQADVSDSRSYEGFGLGLSIVQAYVELLNGRIWLDSDLGKGTTFYFTLPYYPVRSDNSISGPEEKIVSTNTLKKLKVLIVEDNDINIRHLSLIMNDYASEVIVATDGLQAVEICKDISGIDLIMMDIRLPGISGHEATKRIREFNKETVIIAQTAFALPGDRQKAIDAGCNDYISKPIRMHELNSLLDKYFGLSG